MQVLRDRQSISNITNQPLRVVMERCVQAILDGNDLTDDDFPEVMRIIVADPGDLLEEIEEELGFSIPRNNFDSVHFGFPGFARSFELVEDHGDCFEIVFVLDDSGYGIELFVPKHPDVPQTLLDLCAALAVPAKEQTDT